MGGRLLKGSSFSLLLYGDYRLKTVPFEKNRRSMTSGETVEKP